MSKRYAVGKRIIPGDIREGTRIGRYCHELSFREMKDRPYAS
jgi:hypothetical protein